MYYKTYMYSITSLIFFNVTEPFWKPCQYLLKKIRKFIFVYSRCKSLYVMFIFITSSIEKDSSTSDNLDSQVTCQQTSQIDIYYVLKNIRKYSNKINRLRKNHTRFVWDKEMAEIEIGEESKSIFNCSKFCAKYYSSMIVS